MNPTLRQQVRERAKGLCEYCHSPEQICSTRFTLDHIIPRSLGGSDAMENLALACQRCNERRYNFVGGVDPLTQQIQPLYNPRQQHWAAHFMWTRDGSLILGTTPTGRATVKRLDLNDERYPNEDSIQSARQLWQQVGIHPPDDDPIEAA
ncbi:MAG: HNH endonuclease signature motif containing protein [Cyanobacteria bacterium P01_G01_bin.54]